MGSKVYAERCKARRDRIVAMIAVDSVGCYSNERGSQKYPPLVGWFMPSTGNFVAFGSDLKNRPLLDFVVGHELGPVRRVPGSPGPADGAVVHSLQAEGKAGNDQLDSG